MNSKIKTCIVLCCGCFLIMMEFVLNYIYFWNTYAIAYVVMPEVMCLFLLKLRKKTKYAAIMLCFLVCGIVFWRFMPRYTVHQAMSNIKKQSNDIIHIEQNKEYATIQMTGNKNFLIASAYVFQCTFSDGTTQRVTFSPEDGTYAFDK